MNVSQLSDQELREALLNHGVQVGPIVPSTRSVYIRKLEKILSADSSVLNDQTNGDVNEPVAEKEELNMSTMAVNGEKSHAGDPIEEDEAVEDDEYEGEESMRYLTEEELEAERIERMKLRKSNNKWSNMVLFGVAFAAIAVFIFFLLENTEILLNSMQTNVDDTI